MIEKTIEVERMEHVISVFGSFDQNLRIIENELGVKVLDRDDKIHICGEAEDVLLAEKAINGLLTLAAKGENIDAQNVRYILKLVKDGKETQINQLAGDVICITAKGKPIKPKTLGQKEYCEAIAENTVVCPVCCSCSYGGHCYVIYEEHNGHENRKPKPAACYDSVYSVGAAELMHALSPAAGLNDFPYIDVSFICDD